jgi:hypothetical protein
MRDSGQTRYTIEQLIDAIQEKKDISEIKEIISGVADVNHVDHFGVTPLFMAAREGHSGVVAKLLVVEGINVSKANRFGVTPLLLAARQGHTEIVEQLLAAEGIDVNEAMTHGITPLFMAAREGHAEVVAQLLSAGADESLLSEVDQDRFKDIIAEGEKKLKTDYLERLGKRAIAINQGQRSNGSGLSILPEVLLKPVVEFSLNVKQPSFVSDEDVKTAIQSGQDKFEHKRFISQGEVTSLSEQGPVSELIFRIKQLETRGINLESIHVTNKDGKYIYHYDAGTGAAVMAEKPLAEITSAQQAELLRRVTVEEARLSERDPTSVTAIEAERSFVSRVNHEQFSKSLNL